ncbi:MAG TPA: copper chaperone PCu(A)C [Casimicrobiaceae bacterium]|nr:copper chaperone PCu(A)C [Casimicrobiaceae bacterium]
MNRLWVIASACALYALWGAAAAAVVNITEPWVRPAAAGETAEAYLRIQSSEDATLADARCPRARATVLVAASKRTPPPFSLALPAKETVRLKAGGVRLALVQLAHPLKAGERVPITLVLRYADGRTQDIEVDAEVRRRSPSADHGVPD